MTERKTNKSDELLDRAIAAARDDGLDDETVERAAARVWGRVSSAAEELAAAEAVEGIVGCADYQALFPDLVAGRLTEARAILVEDHARGCVSCRKVLARAKSGEPERPAIALVDANDRLPLWSRLPVRAIAAAIALVVGLAGVRLAGDMLVPAPVLAHAETVDGALYRVTEEGTLAVAPGEAIRADETIRVARDAGAVLRLTDGSLLELDARSEVALAAGRGDTTVRLARGNIIVQAAEQGSGHLNVVTDDCRVSVTGTIFTVRHGTKGSRVSVLEGEVWVEQDGDETVLRPGEQVSTDPRLGRLPIDEEISWSRDVDSYVELLAEFQELREDLRQIEQPELRADSSLLPAVPADTVIYVALPNVSNTLAEAYRLLETRAAESEVLRQWWQSTGPGGEGDELAEAIGMMEKFGEYLGEEIVIAARVGDDGEPDIPVVLAELGDPEGFRATVQTEIDRLLAEHQVDPGDEEEPILFVDDAQLAAAAAAGDEIDGLLVWMGSGYLAAGPDPVTLSSAVAALTTPGGTGFADTPFGQRIRAGYADGISWLLAADMRTVLANSLATEGEDNARLMGESGLMDFNDLIVAHRQIGEVAETRATLAFDGPRRGIAAWLAEPAPMGALDYLTADAYVASAFVVKEPAAMLQDMLGFAKSQADDFETELAEADAAAELALVEDLAAALGGEVALALDGPVLPKPAWKVVAEVYDADRLQAALEALLERANARLADMAAEMTELEAETDMELGGWALVPDEVNGRTAYAVRQADGDVMFYYVIVDGYLIAAPERALLERAMQVAEVGNNLANSQSFTSRLPHDTQANLSAVVYQNLQSVLGPLMDTMSLTDQALTDDQVAAVEALGEELSTSMVYAYAEADRVTVASTTEAGFLGLDPANLLGIGGFMELGRIFDQIDIGQGELP